MDSDSNVVNLVKSFVKKFNENIIENKQSCFPVEKSLFNNFNKDFVEAKSSTNFCQIACKAVPYNDDKSVLYLVLANVLEKEFLFSSVRGEIGAYGVWAIQHCKSGIFSIMSFRDPNPIKCLEAFDKALDDCASSDKVNDEMIDRAIMAVFAKFDRPLGPSYKCWSEFVGKTKETIQKRRNILFNATKEQIVELAKTLKKKDWRYGIFSNPSSFKPPEGYEIIKLAD